MSDDRLKLSDRARTVAYTHAPHIHSRGWGGLTVTVAKERSTATHRMRGKCSQSEEELLMILTCPQQRVGSFGDYRGEGKIDNYSLHDDRVKLSDRGRTDHALTSTTEDWERWR